MVSLSLAALSTAAFGNPFGNIDNTPFNTRANGPQGAIAVSRPAGVMSTAAMTDQAVRYAVQAQHGAGRLQSAQASHRRLQAAGVKSRRGEVRFPRVMIHTQNNRAILPDLVNTLQSGGTIGDPANQLTFEFEGWSNADEQSLRSYLQRAMPRARAVYGPPAFNITVKIIRDTSIQAIQGGIYDATKNEIRMPALTGNVPEDTYILLLLVLHAFHDDTLFFYDAWEQGFAGAAAYAIQSSPGIAPGYDPIDPGPFYALSVYEPQNQPELGNSTFYPDSGATNMLVWRIAMTRAAWLKCYIEKSSFFADFNRRYYASFTPELAGDVPGLRDIAAQVLPTVEGLPFAEWFQRQYVLDTSVRLGPKLYTWNIPLEQSVALICELYETLPGGDEQPFGGQARTIYWNFENNIQLFAEEGNLIDIPSGGATPGEGFLLPTFFNIGGPQRITVQVDVAGLRRFYIYPYGKRGFSAGENNIYGGILNTARGTIDVKGGNDLADVVVDRGVWGGRLTVSDLTPMQVKVTFTNALGQAVERFYNIGWDSYCLFIDGGRQTDSTHSYRFDQTGLHMVSLPVTPLSRNAAQIFGISADTLLLAWWDPPLPRGEQVPPVAEL